MKIRHTLDQSLTYIFIVIFKGEYIFKNPSVFFFAVVVVQSVSRVWLFATPWTTARQVSLSFTISWSLLKLMFIESLIPFNHFILCHPLLLPSVFPSIRVFSQMSPLFPSGGKSIRASASVFPMNIGTDFLQDWLVWSPCYQGTLKSLLQHQVFRWS